MSRKLISRSWRVFSVALMVALGAVFFSGCKSSNKTVDPPVPTFEVDTDLMPLTDSIPFAGGTETRPVAVVADDEGNRVDFVENEVLVAVATESDIASIAARLGGTVLRTVDTTIDNANPTDTPFFALIRVDDPPTATPEELTELIMATDGFSESQHRFSSQRGLDLLTAIATESQTMGTSVGANFLLQPAGLSERSTSESATAISGGGYSADAFALPYMSRGSTQDIGAAEAARLVRDAGRAITGSVPIGIIDSGFSTTPELTNVLMIPPSALDRRNTSDCSGGNPCPWHGTSVASSAMGAFDDGIGAAGPAAEVGRPLLLAVPGGNLWEILEFIFVTIPAAIATRPGIVNISSSGDIPAGLCLVGVCTAADIISAALHSAGTQIFASAGNDSANVDDEDCFPIVNAPCWESNYRFPCEAPGVMCIGALAHTATGLSSFSAFGSEQTRESTSVDLYAPGSVWVLDDPDGGTTMAMFTSGTSFSSPFAASIAALMKAANPALSNDQITDKMIATANINGGPRVHRWINAYEAVKDALGGNAPPFVRYVGPTGAQAYPLNASVIPLSCEADDDGPLSELVAQWSSNRAGVFLTGRPQTSFFATLALGGHAISCTVSDGEYSLTRGPGVISIVNNAPTVSLTYPAADASFFAGQAIPLNAVAIDRNRNLRDVQWRVFGGDDDSLKFSESVSSSTGRDPLGRTIPVNTLEPGEHLITVVATDDIGAVGGDEISVQILENPDDIPPSITDPMVVESPLNDSSDNPQAGYYWADSCLVDVNGPSPGNGQCQRLTFSATVSDDNETPAELNILWRVRIRGVTQSSLTTALPTFQVNLPVENYTVELEVTDDSGGMAKYVWTFTVNTLI